MSTYGKYEVKLLGSRPSRGGVLYRTRVNCNTLHNFRGELKGDELIAARCLVELLTYKLYDISPRSAATTIRNGEPLFNEGSERFLGIWQSTHSVLLQKNTSNKDILYTPSNLSHEEYYELSAAPEIITPIGDPISCKREVFIRIKREVEKFLRAENPDLRFRRIASPALLGPRIHSFDP